MNPYHVGASQNHMATTFDFIVSTPHRAMAEEILAEAHRLVTTLEKELSEFLPESPIYRLNQAPIHERILMPDSALELLNVSAQISDLTRSAFSCTAKTPGARGRLGWNHQGEAWRETAETHASFGAIGKGYALDRVRTLLEGQGFTNYFLNAGGSSKIISGFASERTPWTWGWSWSPPDETPVGYSFVHPSGISVAIGVSGTEVRGNHLIDSRKKPMTSSSRFKSALIAHPSAAQADAFSTALFVSGWEDTTQQLEKATTPPAMALIDEAGVPRWNGIFQQLWGTLCAVMLFISTTLIADETVDLSDLGTDDFTPYIIDRNPWWMLLPVLALGIVALHLKDSRPRPQIQTKASEET